jgi:hypothetical protein
VNILAMYRAIITAAAILATAPAIIATAPAAGSQSSQGHWCRQGDPALYASMQTPCRLAGNIITDYVNVCHESASCQLRVNSPVSLNGYRVACRRAGTRDAGTVYCHGTTGTGVWTRFSSLI